MYRSEKKSLYRFLLIYFFSTFVLFLIGSSIFYAYERHQLLDRQRESLKQEGGEIRHQLMILHKRLSERLPLVIKKPYDCALLDSKKQMIFSTFSPPYDIDLGQEFSIRGQDLFYTKAIEPYHLGVAYIAVQVPINLDDISKLKQMILLFMAGAGFFFLIIGYFLGRLFTAPMRESIEMMNSFIQDTTHELNTPVSTILTNIELIETLYDCDAKKEMQRIEIASKTLSRIYDDLTYLKLNHAYSREIRPLDLSNLLQERLIYFATTIEAKNITLLDAIEEDVTLDIDRNDALRLIDNLLSNAIKYNKAGGLLEVFLTNKTFRVKDNGIGIEAKDLETIFERFKRANKSEGGFGIGLNIVYQIVQTYDLDIAVTSQPNQGMEVTLSW